MNTSISISPAAIADVLRIHAATPGAKPPMFLGLPGIGKTAILQQFADDNNFDLFSFMAPHYSVPDIKGFGVPDRERGRMTFMPSDELPWAPREGSDVYAYTHGGRRPLLFLDETTNATGQVFNLLLQLTHERRIGLNRLCSDVFIASAGNTAAMRTGSNKLTMSLADRFAIYNIEPNMADIVDWMSTNGISPWVVAYLKSIAAGAGQGLWTTKAADWNGEEPIDSARSYEKLSRVLQAGFHNDDAMMVSSPLFPTVCAAHIGQKAGLAFSQFVQLSIQVGPIEDLIRAADTCAIPDSPSLRWGIAVRSIPHACSKENTFNDVIRLARRLTPESMRPSDAAKPSVFEVFVVKAAVQYNPRIATWPSVKGQLQRSAAAITKV
jgi:hypothetical protein